MIFIIFIYLALTSQIVLDSLHITLTLLFYMDVVLTLYINDSVVASMDEINPLVGIVFISTALHLCKHTIIYI